MGIGNSVGMIIKDKEGRLLFLERKKIPFGFACPAGHIEEGESPEEAAKRELFEETGFHARKLKKIDEEYVDWNICQKHRGHNITLFEVLEYSGTFRLENDAHKSYKWSFLSEMKVEEIEEVWLYFFKKHMLL